MAEASSKLTSMLKPMEPEGIVAVLKKNNLLSEKAINGEAELHKAIASVIKEWHDVHDNRSGLLSWCVSDAVEHELFESGWLNEKGANLSDQGVVDGRSLGKFAKRKQTVPLKYNFFQRFIRTLRLW